jgi:hypothetical protein
VQGDAGHAIWQGGNKKNNTCKQMKGQGGGEVQGVTDPLPPQKKPEISYFAYLQTDP